MSIVSGGSNPSFAIQIKGTANHTWQGVLTWIDKGENITFRSALELLQLINSAIEDNSIIEELSVKE